MHRAPHLAVALLKLPEGRRRRTSGEVVVRFRARGTEGAWHYLRFLFFPRDGFLAAPPRTCPLERWIARLWPAAIICVSGPDASSWSERGDPCAAGASGAP